jgi:hypothetical protein
MAGALFIVINLIALLILSFGQGAFELLIRSAISPVAGTLLVLGLFGLYARQAEATGMVGLISFLFILFGTILALAGNVWANLVAYLGWALFGVSSWQASIYPSMAAILLTLSALISTPFSILIAGGGSTTLVYIGVGGNIIFNLAIVWLGLALYASRRVSAEAQHET